MSATPEIDDVRAYWEGNPLYSFEVGDPGSPEFFEALDKVKREDVERFSLDYWAFDSFRGNSVLDVGCGPGWLTVQYAAAGADVTSVDLTDAAVELTRKQLEHHALKAKVRQANAEELPFDNESFDLVVSSGVLHHTPDTQKAFGECSRVLKRGGAAKITLYRLGLLHSPLVFPLTQGLMRLLSVKHPGADMAREAGSVGDFVRQYDGKDNPVGIAKTDADWAQDLADAGFHVLSSEVHFFPMRFVPLGRHLPHFAHHALDRAFGTMVYFELSKA